VLVRPVKRLFSRRWQWTFELRASNGARIDPRDTIYNRPELVDALTNVLADDPLELVIYDRHGKVESRTDLR
jgi:hypothetical protein